MTQFIRLSSNPYAVRVAPETVGDRLTAVSYNQSFLAFTQLLDASSLDFEELGKHIEVSAMIGWKNLTTKDYVNVGVKMLRVADIKDQFVYLDEAICVSPEKVAEQPQIHLRPGDVVLSKDGTLGIAAVVPEVDELLCAGSTLARLRKKTETFDEYFLMVYLNSRYTQAQISFYISGIAQPHIIQEYIRKLKLPKPLPTTQTYIGDKVRLAERCREEGKYRLDQARKLLIEVVGFDLYNHSTATIIDSGKFYRIFSSTPACVLVSPPLLGNGITATRYLPADLAKDETMKSNEVRLAYLREIAKDFINGYDYRNFQSEGTPYLKVANIRHNEVVFDGIQFVPIGVTSLSGKFQMRRGDLLITRKGSFGICTTVLPQMEKMIFSSEIIRVPLKKGWDSDYIALFLNSPFGRYQFDRLATGTTMKGVNHENLADIGVPKLDLQIQTEIGDHVRKFMQLTEKAKALIHEAKTDIEKLIEGKLDTEGIMAGRVKAPTWADIEAKLEEKG